MDMRKSPIAIATLLLVLLGLVGGALEAHATYKVSVAVLPTHWASLINLVGQPFVYAFSPLPPHVPYRYHAPSREDLMRALEADIIVVEDTDNRVMGGLIELAQKVGKRYIVVEDEARKLGWSYISKPSGGYNRYASHDFGLIFLMLQLVRDEVVKVAREKRVPEAQVREFLIRYDAAMSTLRAVYSASMHYGMQRAMWMKGVAILHPMEGQYMMKAIGIDPVAVAADENQVLTAQDLRRLKEAGVRCLVILEEDLVLLKEKFFPALREVGIKPIIVRSLKAQEVGAPFLNYALLGELIASECAEEPAPAPACPPCPPCPPAATAAPAPPEPPAAPPSGVGGLTIDLKALATVVMVALPFLLAFLLLQRRFGGGSLS